MIPEQGDFETKMRDDQSGGLVFKNIKAPDKHSRLRERRFVTIDWLSRFG
jgi:hypothetical protein